MQAKQIKDLLRLTEEPYRQIDELAAHQCLVTGCESYMDVLQAFYLEWSQTPDLVHLPPKQVFALPADGGDFRVMPCVIASRGIHCVKIIGTNVAQQRVIDKISVGKALLLDSQEHFVRALFDVAALSSFRTAAIAVLAYRLSRLSGDAVALIGAGRIGFYTALILSRWLGLREFSVVEPDLRNRQRFGALCAQYLPDTRVRYLPITEACAGASAAFFATTSHTALCDLDQVADLRFIASVGADADDLSEVDGSLLERYRLWTDSRQSMLLGDMRRWRDQGLIEPEAVPELRDLMQPTRVSTSDPILFISTGVAVQDALTCDFIDRHHG